MPRFLSLAAHALAVPMHQVLPTFGQFQLARIFATDAVAQQVVAADVLARPSLHLATASTAFEAAALNLQARHGAGVAQMVPLAWVSSCGAQHVVEHLQFAFGVAEVEQAQYVV